MRDPQCCYCPVKGIKGLLTTYFLALLFTQRKHNIFICIGLFLVTPKNLQGVMTRFPFPSASFIQQDGFTSRGSL